MIRVDSAEGLTLKLPHERRYRFQRPGRERQMSKHLRPQPSKGRYAKRPPRGFCTPQSSVLKKPIGNRQSLYKLSGLVLAGRVSVTKYSGI